ncbi:hypothetical protein [Streptomyces sp. NPDC048002]|uniref:hypothetical protein n=1 Tax=Streptomyces sp. NPDC048002 TaxID=3154344 RepID=UPI0033F407CF
MLENWYFCAAVGLPPGDAADHLDTIAALREPVDADRAEELICAALDFLRQSESGMRLHALPYVLAAHRSLAGRREVSARATAFYRLLAGSSPEGTQTSFEALLREAGGRNQNKAVDLLQQVLEQVQSRDYTADPTISPYLDLMEQFAPSLLLIVGRFLARHRGERMREQLRDRPVMLLAALRGEHGRLALIQAAEWSATVWPETADEVRRALALLSGGAFDMEPDLLMSAVRVTFGDLPGDADDTAVTAMLDQLEQEAMSGVRLLGWVEQYGTEGDWRSPAAVARRQAAYVRLGGVAAHRDSVLPAVLWQHTLTAFAVELAPQETARRLEPWWQPPVAFPPADKTPKVSVSVPFHPEDYGHATKHVGRLLRLRTPPPVRKPQPSHPQPVLRSGPAAETEPGTAARVWSPWMLEPESRSNGKEENSGSPGLTDDEPEQLIRLLGAGLLSERLLTSGRRREGQPDFLLLLTIHIKDVLGRRYHKLRKAIDEHTGRSLVPGGHLAGLITHVASVTDRVGKGLRSAVHPSEFLRVLQGLHENGPDLRNGQALWGLVRFENGLVAALDWAKESVAGGVGPHRTEAGGRWFVGDPSAADALCDLVARQGKHPARRAAERAALLRREIHGAGTAAPLRWDWKIGYGPVPPFRRGPKKEKVLPDHQLLLLSGPKDAGRHGFSCADWVKMGQDMEELSHQAAEEQRQKGKTGEDRWRFVPLAARTLRLATLLEQSPLGDESAVEDGVAEEWVASWAELITSLNSPQMLPRGIRSRLLDLFHVSPAGLAEQRRLIAILERVIDVIIDLSPRAPLYYDRLFAEVAGPMTLPAESANLLRHRVLRSFYHRWSNSAPAKSRPHPFDTHGTRISARGTEAALISLLRATAHLEFPSRGVPLAAVMTEAWELAQRPQFLVPVRQDMDMTTLDPRLVAAATVDRRTAEVVLYQRTEALDVAISRKDERRPVRDLFTTGPDGPVASGYVLGVVSAVIDNGRSAKLVINCGLPQLVNYPLQFRHEREYCKVGRNLAVHIEAGKISEIAPLAVPQPRHGDVRGAVLDTSDTFPWLSLKVDGIGADCYAHGDSAADIAARRLWDPDLSRRFAPRSGAWPVRTLAMWHGKDKRWVPLDSGLAELCVAQGAMTVPEETAVLRLVLCDRATDRGGHGPALRFALSPGRTYVLGPSDWYPEDWRLLERACAGAAEGLIVYAAFAPGENRLRLAPPAHDGKVFDRRNIDWLAVFTHSSTAQDDADGSTGPSGDDDLYEKVFVETGPGGTERWCIEVPPVEGFPSTVTAVPQKGGAFRGRSVLCTVTRWGEREARRAEVGVLLAKETGFSLACSTEHYELLRQYESNEFVEVDIMTRDPEDAASRVRTVDGISGLADTESLTLTGEFPVGRTRRWAIVTRDKTYQRSSEQRPEPFAHELLVENCRGLSDPALLTGPTLTGIVAGRILNTDHRLTHLRIWLHLGKSVVEVVDVPASAFDQGKKVYVGNQLTASRAGDGWSFFVHGRDLRLRGLWTEQPAPGGDWKSVGTMVTPDNELKEVFQHPDLPSIAVAEPGDAPAAVLGLARAKSARGRAHPPRGVVQFDRRTLVGTVSGEALTDAYQDVHVDSTELEIFEFDEEQAEDGTVPLRLFDVSRTFVLSPAVPSQTVKPAPAAPGVKPEIAWEEIRAGIIEGQLTDDKKQMLLPTHYAPDDQGIYRRWLAVVDGPQTMVGGRKYLTDRVRCVAVDSGRGARGSHLLVPPVQLLEFLAEALPHGRPNGRRYEIKGSRNAPSKRPYYVGAVDTEEGSVHRFEFGYGWFVDIPAPALTIGGKTVGPASLALFHGDQVRALSFSHDSTVPGGIAVKIAPGDVSKNIESQVYDEATKRVLHLLDVSFDHARGLVLVERVHTGNRPLRLGKEDVHVKDEPVSAYLDPDDARALLAKYGPEKRTGKFLARLERKKTDPARKALLFALVPLRPADGGKGKGLRQGDRIYLTAGKITRTTNDYRLRFGLPQGADLPEDAENPTRPLTVKVLRRDFAHRENCLRRAMETHKDKEAVYKDQVTMLVRLDSLHDGPRNDWTGSTKFPLARPLHLLHSYLDETRTDCFGTVADGGSDKQGRVRKYIEIRPGILFPAENVLGAADIAHGSVVRLRRHHDTVSAHVAIPADGTFLGNRPRPVVVFPKDRLTLDTAHRPRSFTLAGLPGIGAQAGRATDVRRTPGVDLLRTPHPKITGVVEESGSRRDTARLVPLRGALAGRIVPAEECTAGARVEVLPVVEGAPTDRNGSLTLDMDWSQLSFMDGTAQQIADACAEHYWRYHDRVTCYWPEGEDTALPQALPDKARSIKEPIFFSPVLTTWTLRHTPAELRRFGFPATDLVENLRTTQTTCRTAWAVAWADTHTLWLELAPGRVVEICAELVRFSDGGSLGDLDWSFFAPGDLVYGQVEGDVNECGHLTLDTWHPGVRGALGSSFAQRMLLPVTHVNEAEGALLLGDKASTFPYPADQRVLDAYSTAGAVWLNRHNELTALADSPPTAGDVVFLSSADDALCVQGLPRARVLIAAPSEDHWPDCDWLREALVAANRGGVLDSELSGIAVTVEHSTADAAPVLTVSRRAQPGGPAATGSVLVQPLADLGQGYVAVRSGSALFRVHMRDVLPALPATAAVAAASALTACGKPTLRLYWDAQTRKLTGRPSEENAAPGTGSGERGETTVRPWLSVNDAEDRCLGLICHDERDHLLTWLDASDAAWTADLMGDTLLKHLQALRRVVVLRTVPGAVTLTGHSINVREYDNLTPGQRRRVTVIDPAPPVGEGTGLPRRCLVAVEPLAILAEYTLTEGTALPTVGETLSLEVSRAGRGSGPRLLALVEHGSRLTVTDLPGWTIRALDSLYDARPYTSAAAVDGLIDPRFDIYRSSYADDLGGTRTKDPSIGPAVEVLRVLGALDRGQEITETVRADASSAVRSWLSSPEGRATVLQESGEVDLAPLLAVCWLGIRVAGHSIHLPQGWVTYLLARLGDRAVSSLHTEALVTKWITQPKRHKSQGGDWRRLRTVEIASKLTEKQVSAILGFGEAITARPMWGLKESEAAPVARSLLAAIGALPTAQALRDDAFVLCPLADLAAGLRPPGGKPVPDWNLLHQQQMTVRTALDQVVGDDAIPLTLLPACLPLMREAEAYGKKLLREAGQEQP